MATEDPSAVAAAIGSRTAAVSVAAAVAGGQAGMLMAVAAVVAAETLLLLLPLLYIILFENILVLPEKVETLHLEIISDCRTNVLGFGHHMSVERCPGDIGFVICLLLEVVILGKQCSCSLIKLALLLLAGWQLHL